MALDISSPLPTVGGDLGTWGTKLNTAITEIINEAGKDSDIVSLQSTKADKTNTVLEGTVKLSGLAGTGSRMVVADSTGNLSASGINTYTPTLVFQLGQVGSFTQSGSGSYIITGNMVKVIFSIGVTALPSAGSFLSITLPISRKAGTVLSGHFSRYNGINVGATADFIGLSNYGVDLTSAWFIKSKNDGTGGLNGVSVSELSSGVTVQGVIEYEI